MNSLPLGAATLVLMSAAYSSAEVRLLTGDANNQLFNRDAFLLDLSTDGKLVLFASDPPSTGIAPPGVNQGGLYIRDLAANTLTFTGATNVGGEGSFSDDGRSVTWVTRPR